MNISEIKDYYDTELATANSLKQLDEIKVKYFGKKGLITALMKEMGSLSREQRAIQGKELNLLKKEMLDNLAMKKSEVEATEMLDNLKSEMIDVTIPGVSLKAGLVHPLRFMEREVVQIFSTMGFEVVSGPEVETDEYNFEMLNIPKNHPAREMQDTLYFNESMLLRTHTSPVQIRHMLANSTKGPLRLISPGKVYRKDDDDATHSHQFMQIEGLVVDEGISLAHLKGVLENVIKAIFGEERQVRLRSSFFPFTEPSVEVDMDCFKCNGSGCNICKGTGFVEVLGAGMVHPKVLENVGYDTEKYTGFAFGFGVERFCMLKYEISDIREFYRNDFRFLSQFTKANVRGGNK